MPKYVRPKDIAGNVRKSLQAHLKINGPVVTFSAYGDFSAISERVKEGCHTTGIKLVDMPNGRKDAADKAILVDMFLFALDNREPCSIMLISGAIDFAPALHILGQRGYTIIIVIPFGVNVSSSLKNAGKYVWDWRSMAHGEGFEHGDKRVTPHSSEKEKAMCTPGASSEHKELTSHVQPPRGVSDLKGQIVRLLELSGGSLSLFKLHRAYDKMYGRSLRVSEYGVSKLSKLLGWMDDVIIIEGKDRDEFVYLRSSRRKGTKARSSR